MFWFILISLLLFLWTFALLVLDGPNMREFDTPTGEKFDSHPDDAAANQRLLKQFADMRSTVLGKKSLSKGMTLARDFADNLSADFESDCEFIECDANGVKCEWAIAPQADRNRRVLLLHGGAFIVGTPKGHRKMAHNLSHMANAAVLSVDYRMLPEHNRMAATLDAQSSYLWILENGPDGPAASDWLLVAGDSAGGNLSLMISTWSKQNAARIPDGVVAIGPNTDTTLSADTYRTNRQTDRILGPALGLLAKLPRSMSLWFGCLSMRGNPSNPLVSPLFGDLSGLAPTLLQVSNIEMMLDDSIRYTNKARAAGSEVKLQIWQDQLHDWHLFNLGHGSANTAWDEIEKFIKTL